MPIVPVGPHHESAIRSFERDFDDAGEARIPAWFADRAWTQAERVARVNGWERGEYLQPGWVGCTTRFLEEDGVLLGVVNVRHTLTDSLRHVGGHVGYAVRPSARRRGHGTTLLRAGLEVCAGLGITEALITCDETNVGSVRVIANHGGRQIEREPRADGPAILRFRVPTGR